MPVDAGSSILLSVKGFFSWRLIIPPIESRIKYAKFVIPREAGWKPLK